MKKERHTKINLNFEFYFKFTGILISVFVSYLVGVLIYCASFYVHEGGHIAFGLFDNLLYGEIARFEITSWINCPLIPFFKLPQQTTLIEGHPSLNFIFGGIIAIILVSMFISYLFYKQTNKKIYWLFPVVFTYHELLGNFLCGTDNPLGKPFQICEKNILVGNLLLGHMTSST